MRKGEREICMQNKWEKKTEWRKVRKVSLPRDAAMINVTLSQRWRGETTVIGEESWPGAEKEKKKGYDVEMGKKRER